MEDGWSAHPNASSRRAPSEPWRVTVTALISNFSPPFSVAATKKPSAPCSQIALESAAESQCVEEIGIVGNCELLRDEGSMRLVNSLFHALSRLSHSLAARTLTTVESRGALRLSNAARVWRPSTCEGWAPQLSARAECSNICPPWIPGDSIVQQAAKAHEQQQATPVVCGVARGGHACRVAAVRQGGVSGTRRVTKAIPCLVPACTTR